MSRLTMYQQKDAEKFSFCTHLAAYGSVGSSSDKYAKGLLGEFSYEPVTTESIVGISTNGNRPNRLKFPVKVLERLKSTGCTVVTDNLANRNRSYNCGEREVADWLLANGYTYVDYTTHAEWKLPSAIINAIKQLKS